MKTFPQGKQEILERVGRLTPGSARLWGKMNVHQMVCHLKDSYLLPMGERTGTDMSNFFNKTVVKYAALRMPMRWPKGVETVPELDQAAGAGTPPGVFEDDRAQLVHLIHRFSMTPRDFQFAPHPIFGEMIEWEWLRWGYLHADHHLRQFGV